MSQCTLTSNTYTENGITFYLFTLNSTIINYQLYRDNITLESTLHGNPSAFRSYDNKYYCNRYPYESVGDDAVYAHHHSYLRVPLNTALDSETIIYFAPIEQYSSNSDIYCLKIYDKNRDTYDGNSTQLPPGIPLNTFKYTHSNLFSGLHITGFQQNNKINASDINLLKQRLQDEINRRSCTGTSAQVSAAQAVWSSTNGKTNWGTNNTLSSSLATFAEGNKINASDINTLLNTLDSINTNEYWSSSSAVTAGNLIKALIETENTLTKIESGLNQTTESNIKDNYSNNIGYPRGNMSGCNTACLGLCQSCLGSATGSGSGGSGCPGDCTGSGCVGGCQGGCQGGDWAYYGD